MKLVFTGATGFVGLNLIPYLTNKGFDIQPISRNKLYETDISINTTDVVIHLAGKAHDLKKASNPEEYYEVNFELTKKLYDAFLKSDAKKFIFVSSVKAVADSVEGGSLTEDIMPNPQTHYGKSKLMAEEYIQNQPLEYGKSYYILRPCMIHGPGNKGNLNLLFNVVKKGIPYPLAKFENRRSFLSVENLCFVINSIIEKEVPAGIYNVADDEALSTNEVVEAIAHGLNKNTKLWRLPVSLIKVCAKIGDVFRLPLNTERLQKLTENYEVSNAKIRKALSTDLPLSAKEGLKRTIRSFVNA